VTKDLAKEVRELNKRITELEKIISSITKPLMNVGRTTQNYLKITNLILDHGGLTPDLIIPDLKDTISRDIVRVLLEKPDQNISQITELVKNKRGTASRRIIRERLKELDKKNIVERYQKGSLNVYRLSEEVIKKWSKLLGFNI
jgi:DNA-binding transcriptional ArsR family regulator